MFGRAARDIVKYLCDKKVSSVDDFNWVAQLRYYWRYDDEGKLKCGPAETGKPG